MLVFVLNFLVPSGMAQLAIVAPMILGLMVAFGVEKGSNIGRGLFIILTYTCGLFNKMILAGGASILTRGLVEKLTGHPISWSLYFIAYLPADLISIFACWLTILWLYPPEKKHLPGGREYLKTSLAALGPWKSAEKKTLGWLLLAIALWSTDALHGMSPAVIAMGIGLAVSLPMIGVLKTKDIRSINFLLIIFLGGALSMGEVLIKTKALDTLTGVMMSWMDPLLSDRFFAASALYWTGFLYHFGLASELSMISTSLPVIIKYAQTHGYNPVALAMLWNFASGGKLFVYQSSVLVLGYSFGHFEGRDLLKVGAVLTLVEGLVVMFLVPIYWPMIGLHWGS
jgi:di/tricarboxylate transporter